MASECEVSSQTPSPPSRMSLRKSIAPFSHHVQPPCYPRRSVQPHIDTHEKTKSFDGGDDTASPPLAHSLLPEVNLESSNHPLSPRESLMSPAPPLTGTYSSTPQRSKGYVPLPSSCPPHTSSNVCSPQSERAHDDNIFQSSCSPEPALPRWSDFDGPRLDNDNFNEDNFAQRPQYDFRLGSRAPGKLLPPVWLDQDATANYDPKAKHDPYLQPPAEVIFRQKRPRPERPAGYDDQRSKVPRVINWQQGRLMGKRLVVTLSFVTGAALDKLREYGDSLTNWPAEHYNHLQLADDINLDALGNSSDPDLDINDAYTLRQRTKIAIGTTVQVGDIDLRLEDLTLGHPAARGCKACFALGQRCPLLDEGSTYPCDLCLEDDIDCELVIEPYAKARCTTCTKKRIVCSFADDPGARGPCRTCADQGKPCHAGPLTGRTRIGPALDAPPEVPKPRKTRAAVTCTSCRDDNKWCTLKRKRAKPPCERCAMQGLECHVEAIHRKPAKANKNQTAKAAAPDLTKPLSSFALPKESRLLASTKTIVTKLAHPIKFNYQTRLANAVACHWCDYLLYGILGLGEVRPEVVDNNDGQGYIEVSGGHRAAGFPASHMCDVCTLERIMIVACTIHELEPIPEMDPNTFPSDIIGQYMEPGRAASAPFQWCSICPAPAFFRCVKQNDVAVGEMGAEDQGGCGLVLCEFCAVTLVGEHDGSLEQLINGMRRERVNDGFGLRADVEFLHPDGELLRRMTFGQEG